MKPSRWHDHWQLLLGLDIGVALLAIFTPPVWRYRRKSGQMEPTYPLFLRVRGYVLSPRSAEETPESAR